jgi:hypothetical protein
VADQEALRQISMANRKGRGAILCIDWRITLQFCGCR